MEKNSTLLGLLTGLLLKFFGKRPEFGEKELKNMEFRTSTQRIGVGFNERIRGIFRFKWIRKKK